MVAVRSAAARRLRVAAPLLVCATLGLLAGCGASSGGDSTDEATLTVALTDAASDDVTSFTVVVDAITLTRSDGATAAVLAAPIGVDLARLDGLSQLLDLVDVPAGSYTSATVTFDFATAKCVLVGETTPAALFDGDGNVLSGAVTLPLDLTGAPIGALAGRNQRVEFDFDLDASLFVDAAANAVEVDPSLLVRVDPPDPKTMVAYGELQSVDVANLAAAVQLETIDRVPLRMATFQFDGGTLYQVDGVAQTGSAAIAALAAKPAGTWIQGSGGVDPKSQSLQVADVEAGLGTVNGGGDLVEGEVVARSGGAGSDATLTVVGDGVDAARTAFTFNSVFTITTAFATTRVVRRGSAAPFDTDDLNVGQRVSCFGTLSGATLDAGGANGVVREQPTRLFGFANSAPAAGSLEIDLARVDLLDSGSFDWPGGGPTPPDPLHFVCDIASLGDGLAIEAGTPVEASGFFSPFDAARADFTATALVNRAAVATRLELRDRIGGIDVATATTTTAVEFTITGTPGPDESAQIDEGFAGAFALPASPPPTVVAGPAAEQFTLRDALTGATTFEQDYARFTAALAAALADGRRLKDFTAVGAYDAAANTLVARTASAVIR